MGETAPPPEHGPTEPQQSVQPSGNDAIPLPTAQFRRQSWIAFQRALDPLAPPRPLRQPRHH